MFKASGLLKDYWYAIAVSKELVFQKQVKRQVFEIPIVVWRSKNNTLTALLDRCCHRNAPLSEGKIINDCIVCPYHGWTYDKEGRCVKIPSEGPNVEKLPNQKVESFPVLEQDGLIWVWMGRNVPPDKEPFPMPIIKKKGWSSYYMNTKFNNNVTDLVENFMDVPHTVYVHKGWFRDQKTLRVPMYVERTEDSVLVTYDQKDDSIGAFNRMINPKRLPMVHTDKFYMPNVTRVDYVFGEEERGFIITSTCTPLAPFETSVYTLISYKFGWLNILAKLFLPWYTRRVIDQDVWIMDVHGKNIKTFQETSYNSTQADTLHLYIESLRNWAESGGEKSKPKPIRKEAEFWV